MFKLVTTLAALAATTTAQAEPKQESAAVGIAVVGEVASIGLIAMADTSSELALLGLMGLATAPSFGHWYAGDGLTRGMAIRGAGMGVMTLGILEALQNYGDSSSGQGLFALGGLAFLAGTIDDFVTTPSAIRRHNALELRLVPTAAPQSAGLGLAGRF